MKKIAKACKLNIVFIVLLMAICLCGCGETPEATEETSVTTGFVKPQVGTYDSIDTGAIVMALDTDGKKITFFSRDAEKSYTLGYDGTAKIYDKYGSSLVMEQIEAGDVVDVTFTKSKKSLNSVAKNPEVWIYEDVDDFEINSLTNNIKINGGDYKFSDKLKIFSDGREAQLIDINSCDSLVISGVDHVIYSIVIDKGHGYLRLKGQELFDGGWIEIGSKIIKTVTMDMLIAVPVGDYDVKLSNGVHEGIRQVSIHKNAETELDVSDMVVVDDESNEGTIILVMDPAGATVYIDGKQADITKPITLDYGIHQLMAKCEGYNTLTQYIKVAQESATLEISMEPSKNKTEIDGAAGVDPSPQPEVTTFVTQAVSALDTSDYRVDIEAPEGADVYLDGTYVGVVPTSFKKSEGTHVITLRKEGYVTRSYTITLDGLLQNETFSFSSLVKDGDSDDGKSDDKKVDDDKSDDEKSDDKKVDDDKSDDEKSDDEKADDNKSDDEKSDDEKADDDKTDDGKSDDKKVDDDKSDDKKSDDKKTDDEKQEDDDNTDDEKSDDNLDNSKEGSDIKDKYSMRANNNIQNTGNF